MDRDGLPLQNGKHGSASEARACRRNDENSETMSDRKHGCRWKVDGQPTELDRRVLEMARRGCLVPGRELVKTPEQIEGIRRSGAVNTGVLDCVAAMIGPGVSPAAIDRAVHG